MQLACGGVTQVVGNQIEYNLIGIVHFTGLDLKWEGENASGGTAG